MQHGIPEDEDQDLYSGTPLDSTQRGPFRPSSTTSFFRNGSVTSSQQSEGIAASFTSVSNSNGRKFIVNEDNEESLKRLENYQICLLPEKELMT